MRVIETRARSSRGALALAESGPGHRACGHGAVAAGPGRCGRRARALWPQGEPHEGNRSGKAQGDVHAFMASAEWSLRQGAGGVGGWVGAGAPSES